MPDELVITDEHRAKAQLIVRAFWLRHVLTVAEHAWRNRTSVQMYVPTCEEIEEAAREVARMEPQTSLALAGGDEQR